jgi:tetratricopeptide (TPR) repeat protein
LEGNKKVITLKNATVGKVLTKTEGIEFWTPRILDMSLPWKYEGTVHEIPTTEGATETKYKGFEIVHGADGATWKDPDKYNKHVELAKQQDMSVPRHQFYLAQSLRAAGRLNEALVEYRKRAEMKDGWYQEAVYSQLMIGRIYEWWGENEKTLIELMKCYEMDSERNDVLCEILGTARILGMFQTGKIFGEELLQKEGKEEDLEKLFITKTRWDYVYMEMGLCYYYTGEKAKAKKMWEKILKIKEVNKTMIEQAKINLEFTKAT